MNTVPAPGAPPIDRLLIDHLQVLLQPRSIIAFYKCISKLARSRPQSASLSSLDLGLQVDLQIHSITVSPCISEYTQSRSPIASLNLLDHGLQVHLWFHSSFVSKCIFKLARSRPSAFTPSRPPSASPNSLDHSLRVYLCVHSIVILRRTPNCWQSPPAASPDIPCVDR